jgi:hypothetical protein
MCPQQRMARHFSLPQRHALSTSIPASRDFGPRACTGNSNQGAWHHHTFRHNQGWHPCRANYGIMTRQRSKQALPRFTASIGNFNVNESWATLSALEPTGSLVRGVHGTGKGEGLWLQLHQLYSGVLEPPRTSTSYRYSFPSYLPVPSQLMGK